MGTHTLVVEFDGDGPAYAAGDTVLGGRLVAVDFSGDRLAVAEELLEALTAVLRSFPTDGDMRAAGLEQTEIDLACRDYEAARAAIAKATK